MKATKMENTSSRLEILSGNEALGRGAIEAGVSIATSYPGEPVTPSVEYLAKRGSEYDMHVEWSVNEKTAYEVALGSSYAGLRSIVFVKHVGFNWLLDPFVGSAYTGVKGGLVIVVGDDPEATGSTNEEDTRWLTELAEVPLLEPATPNEAKDMVKYAFNLSEMVKLPAVVRVVTRLCRQVDLVELDAVINKNTPSFGETWFVKETLFSQHEELHKKNLRLEDVSEESNFNITSLSKDARIGIIGCGSAFQFAEDLAKSNPNEIALLKIGFIRPPPRRKIIEFGNVCEKILVVEEVQPFLESKIRQTLCNLNCSIYGKLTSHLPWSHTVTPNLLFKSVKKITNWIPKDPNHLDREFKIPTSSHESGSCTKEFDEKCPHRSTFKALRTAVEKAEFPVTVTGDVGCMSLDIKMGNPIIESMTCMGASPSVAAGMKLADPKRRIVAVLGDSSFYHNGLQGIMNYTHNSIPVISLILNNRLTAQTGFQPDLGSNFNANRDMVQPASIENLIRAIRCRVVTVDSFKIDEVEEAISKALKEDDSMVIISNGECPIAKKLGAYLNPDE